MTLPASSTDARTAQRGARIRRFDPPETGDPPRGGELPDAERAHPSRARRSAWRQRLIDAERGMTLGLRGDSAFFVYFFAVSVVLAGAFVLGLALVEWVLVVFAITLVLAAELFKQAVDAVWRAVEPRCEAEARQPLRITAAAITVTIGGALFSVALIFANALWRMLRG